jgi:hypothetical protein
MKITQKRPERFSRDLYAFVCAMNLIIELLGASQSKALLTERKKKIIPSSASI